MNNEKKENVKEDFCPACLAVPIALAGSGIVAGANVKGNHKIMRKVLLISGIILTLISIMIAVYFLFIKKCNECLA